MKWIFGKMGQRRRRCSQIALRVESGRDQVEVIVLEEPSRGFFGLGSKLAKVRVVKKKEPEIEKKEEEKEKRKTEEPSDKERKEKTVKSSSRNKSRSRKKNSRQNHLRDESKNRVSISQRPPDL